MRHLLHDYQLIIPAFTLFPGKPRPTEVNSCVLSEETFFFLVGVGSGDKSKSF